MIGKNYQTRGLIERNLDTLDELDLFNKGERETLTGFLDAAAGALTARAEAENAAKAEITAAVSAAIGTAPTPAQLLEWAAKVSDTGLTIVTETIETENVRAAESLFRTVVSRAPAAITKGFMDLAKSVQNVDESVLTMTADEAIANNAVDSYYVLALGVERFNKLAGIRHDLRDQRLIWAPPRAKLGVNALNAGDDHEPRWAADWQIAPPGWCEAAPFADSLPHRCDGPADVVRALVHQPWCPADETEYAEVSAGQLATRLDALAQRQIEATQAQYADDMAAARRKAGKPLTAAEVDQITDAVGAVQRGPSVAEQRAKAKAAAAHAGYRTAADILTLIPETTGKRRFGDAA